MAQRALDDVDRLLQHHARLAVERLVALRAPVEPIDLATTIIYDHFHLLVVRARREELILRVADFIRALRAHEAE
jgi:hypothetical protein